MPIAQSHLYVPIVLARVLVLLHAQHLDEQLVHTTLNTILKFQEDIEAVKELTGTLLAGGKEAGRKAG